MRPSKVGMVKIYYREIEHSAMKCFTAECNGNED